MLEPVLTMDTITICDLEVHYRVGVTAEERAQPQLLRISVEMDCDVSPAAASDDLGDTIDYQSVVDRLLHFGDDCHWELIETVAVDAARMILADFPALQVRVEVKKFVIAQTRYVSVRTAIGVKP